MFNANKERNLRLSTETCKASKVYTYISLFPFMVLCLTIYRYVVSLDFVLLLRTGVQFASKL